MHARSKGSRRRRSRSRSILATACPFSLVGLADTEVREARDRVRAAIQSAQFEFPQRRITVKPGAGRPAQGGRALRPRDRDRHPRRLGPGGRAELTRLELCGELSLTGGLRPVRGVLAAALAAARAGRALVWPARTQPRPRSPGAQTCCPPPACSRCARTQRPHCARAGSPTPARRRSWGERPPISPMCAASCRRAGRWRCAAVAALAAAVRPARHRQVDAGAAPARRAAADERGRGDRGRGGGLDRGRVRSARPGAGGRSARRTTRPRRPRWWAAARCRARARSRSRTMACCFSTSYRSSTAACSSPCASRSRPAPSPCRVRAGGRSSRPDSSSSPR